MIEDVLVAIKGFQFNKDGEDSVEVIHIGKYSDINGKIYIRYDEIAEEGDLKTGNLIKVSENCVEITKSGEISAEMKFMENEKTMTFYHTAFGSLYLGIFARKVEINRKEDNIRIGIDYSLEVNYEQVSDCKVEISIKPRDKSFRLI